MPDVMPVKKNMLIIRFGRAKGYSFKNGILPNVPGKRLLGLTREPPSAGPKIDPIVQINGMMLKALG